MVYWVHRGLLDGLVSCREKEGRERPGHSLLCFLRLLAQLEHRLSVRISDFLMSDKLSHYLSSEPSFVPV